MTSSTMMASAETSTNKSSGNAIYPLLSPETRDYYEKYSKGLCEERSYDSWGPESAEEIAHWKQWWWASPIYVPFYRIYWDMGFTGRGLKKRKRTKRESSDLVGPMGERIEMDMAPQAPWQGVHTCDLKKPKKRKISPRKILSKIWMGI